MTNPTCPICPRPVAMAWCADALHWRCVACGTTLTTTPHVNTEHNARHVSGNRGRCIAGLARPRTFPTPSPQDAP